jgi:hypothetical protein
MFRKNNQMAISYKQEKDRDHPLATGHGTVLVHRKVLYAKIGPGPHRCHWCGTVVAWSKTLGKSALIADHVDSDPHNNNPDNLVPACLRCNTTRYRPTLGASEFYACSPNGRKIRSANVKCCVCGAGFVSRVSVLGVPYNRSCAKACAAVLRREAALRRKLWELAPNRLKPGEPFIARYGNKVRAVQIKCEQCGAPLLAPAVKSRMQRFCSDQCFRAARKLATAYVEKQCAGCGKIFRVKAHEERWHPWRYCSKPCSAKAYAATMVPRMQAGLQKRQGKCWIKPGEQYIIDSCGIKRRATEVRCAHCDKAFLAKLSELKMGYGKFCSVSCRAVASRRVA